MVGMFVLRYRDSDRWSPGAFVARDNSSGPYSSGGYPYAVDELHRATLFATTAAAKKYDYQDQFDLYEVEFRVKRKVA
jgi:hypothetical protein